MIRNRRSLFLACSYCVLFLLAQGADVAADDWRHLTPLPGDVKIEPPEPSLSPAVAKLSGVWQGDMELC